MEVGNTIFSPEELLSRAKAAAASKVPAGGSAVQKLLAQREDGGAEQVELSGVQKLVQAQADKTKKAAEPYTEQDWYIRLKVQQLRFQLDFYSRLGGGISDSAMNSIEAEIKGLLQKQQDKIKAADAESAAKQKELEEAQAASKSLVPSADELLKRAKARANGEDVPEFNPDDTGQTDPAVDALLKKAKEAAAARGSTINTTA